MNLLEAILLGIIQGLTEFLPVSSSGHLELGKALFEYDADAQSSLMFTIVVHAATALSCHTSGHFAIGLNHCYRVAAGRES
jgi:undecaprenyl-diphosphatase